MRFLCIALTCYFLLWPFFCSLPLLLSVLLWSYFSVPEYPELFHLIDIVIVINNSSAKCDMLCSTTVLNERIFFKTSQENLSDWIQFVDNTLIWWWVPEHFDRLKQNQRDGMTDERWKYLWMNVDQRDANIFHHFSRDETREKIILIA